MKEGRKRIIILGGGFGGVYTAKHLKRQLDDESYEIVLVSRDNYMTFQPMLAEIIGDGVGIYDTVSALSSLLPGVTLYINEIEGVSVEKQEVYLHSNFKKRHIVLSYDHLVIALGNATDFIYLDNGIAQHALRFKSLADTLILRNHIIGVLEAAANEKDPYLRDSLLTFIVGGGGFTGTEVAAELIDFLRKTVRKIPLLSPEEIKLILVHPKDVVLNELSPSLGRYAMKILKKKGVILRLGCKIDGVTPYHATLTNGEKIPTRTVIATAPSNTNRIILNMNMIPLEHGKIRTTPYLEVEGMDNVWAVGDCAYIRLPKGQIAPTTAQFATREAIRLAKNIVAKINNQKMTSFQFKPLGLLAALGHRSAVAELFGLIKISGFLAWIFWRAVYWMKMPGLGRKVKVAFTWFLDLIAPSEPVVLNVSSKQTMHHLHFKKNDMVFDEGDNADFLYIIMKGSVGIYKKEGEASEKLVKELKKGNFFGEIAISQKSTRTAKVVCLEPTDLIAIPKDEFLVMKESFKDLEIFLSETEKMRLEELYKS